MKTVTELLLLTESGNYNTMNEHDNTSTFRFRPDEKQGGTSIIRAASALPKSLQIYTLKELHFFFNLSDSLFSYNFSSISSIGKNLRNVTRLGG